MKTCALLTAIPDTLRRAAVRCAGLLVAAALGVLLAAGHEVAAHEVAAQTPARDARFGLAGGFEAPAMASDTGAAWEIVTFRWDALQPGGPADWNAGPQLSTWPTEALADGREVVGLLVGTPAWATDGTPGSGVPRGLSLAADDPSNLWAGFVQQAVSYGAARGVNRWIVWEAQDGAGWDGSVAEYYDLLKAAHAAARTANPAAVIHLGALGGADPGWLGSFFDVAAADPAAPANNYYFDVVTVRAEFSPEALYTALQTPFVVMQQNGIPLKEVWASRAGIRLAVDPAADPELAPVPDHPNVTLQQQAAYVVQAHALGFAANRGARIALYRLTDDLAADGGEAWGLVRADGSPRPAYDAYRTVVREFAGFEAARRVDVAAEAELEGEAPVEYVRLTFPTRVVHVVWARGPEGATLVIPARSEQARLLDAVGRENTVTPGEDGAYRVAAPPAACNDPQTGCLLGGEPYLLIEEGVADPLSRAAPPVALEAAQAVPTLSAPATPTAAVTPTTEPLATATPRATAAPLPGATAAASAAATTAPTPVLAPEPDAVTPAEPGLPRWLPVLLIAAGVLVAAGGGAYYLRGRRR